MLINSARRLLLAGVPQPALKGRSVDRPTILPVPGEIAPNQDVVFRLRRIARFGRPLCDRPTDAAEVDPSVEVFLSEARLFFDVLREDYPAALNSLEALEARSESPDHHLRLLSLRAQIFLGMGDIDRARDTIEYLRSLDQAVTRRFETTPAGMAFTAESVATNGWGGYLANRLDDLARAKASTAGNDDAPLGHLNPDALLPRRGWCSRSIATRTPYSSPSGAEGSRPATRRPTSASGSAPDGHGPFQECRLLLRHRSSPGRRCRRGDMIAPRELRRSRSG